MRHAGFFAGQTFRIKHCHSGGQFANRESDAFLRGGAFLRKGNVPLRASRWPYACPNGYHLDPAKAPGIIS
jgi:hypothetical protein